MAASLSLALLRSKAWIGGSWVSAANGATFPVFNPSTGESIEDVADVGEQETEAAIMAAHEAQRPWAATVARDRARLLKNFHEIVCSNQEELASLISLEVGKPLAESRMEAAYGASFIEWFSEEASRVYGDLIPSTVKGKRIITTKQPVGVAALVTPWNFPVAMILRKASAALAAGCTCIVKPSEESPLSALALAELSKRAELPPGVFNVLPASRGHTPSVANVLCDSPLVRKLSFTGSTAVGKLLAIRCMGTMKRLSLELGGNAPLLVFDSANVAQAVAGTLASKFRNTGQTCISSNRILVQSGIHDKYVAALNEAVSKLKLGDPFHENVTQGPLINKSAVAKVESHVTDALSKGAEVTVGGGRDETLGDLFYRPSVLTGGTADMAFAREETFGPIAPVMRFEEEEEAISIANGTRLGLAGYIFTSDLSQMWRVGEALEVGLVGINDGAISGSHAIIPFGGVKDSGCGREGSKYGIEDYLDIKCLSIGGLTERQ